MAEAVVDHPRAFAFELMNEPMTIWRRDAFKTWRACAEAIVAVIPDASVGEFCLESGIFHPIVRTHHDSQCATHHASRTNP
jgi:hypothetical protein